jgi:hypothetical protein
VYVRGKFCDELFSCVENLGRVEDARSRRFMRAHFDVARRGTSHV